MQLWKNYYQKQNNRNMKTIIKKYVTPAIILIAGIFIGWLIFHNGSHSNENLKLNDTKENKETIWTCSMHPQIRMDKPGLCPICAMDLIPLNTESSASLDENAITMTKEAVQLANVSSIIVKKLDAEKSIRLFGKIQADESKIQIQASHVSGRIEKLNINFIGEKINEGQTIASIYSPELVTAQEELLELLKMKNTQQNLIEASRQKLYRWKLSNEQVSEIEKGGKAKTNFEIKANTSGYVIKKFVNVGDYISQGQSLFEIANLNSVWAMFDAYESDIPWISNGDNINFTAQSVPGKIFSGIVNYIDPVLNSGTRVSKLRVEINNTSNSLKPEMFITGNLIANLKDYNNSIVIPKSSILWTGVRSLVYIKLKNMKEPTFVMREVTLGPSLGNSYVITEGLNEGEEIVTNGVFSIDASAQLAGNTSMMNTSASQISSGHNHGNMEMGSMNNKKENEKNLKHEMFKVFGNCDMCKERIEKAANSLNGVKSAEWNSENQMLHISFDNQIIKLIDIHKSISKVGHDTEKEKAPDSLYGSLPGCCKYR